MVQLILIKTDVNEELDKSEALTYLQNLIDTVPDIKKSGRKSSEHIRWLSTL
jgi:hypothetical protein